MNYSSMSKEQLAAEKAKLEKEYEGFLASGLEINMTRGKPCVEQLDLAEGIPATKIALQERTLIAETTVL